MERKAKILAALYAWVAQRPGLEFGNYGDVSSYRSEMRKITRQMHDARALLRYVELRDSITADDLLAGFRAFSGRLTYTETDKGGKLDYCTGQYWCTEYRAAVCAVLGTVVFDYCRANLGDSLNTMDRPGDAIRKAARRELGAPIQKRWID